MIQDKYDVQACFPNNVIALLGFCAREIDRGTDDDPVAGDGIRIVYRTVRTTDRTETLSITAGHWTPEEDSKELGGAEPTLQRYTVNVESLVVDMDEERGIQTHSYLSTLVRHLLYRDPALQAAMPALSVTVGGYTESLKRWGINQQAFLNNKVGQSFVFLSSVELWFETDIKNP